jgi:hypothetical protein
MKGKSSFLFTELLRASSAEVLGSNTILGAASQVSLDTLEKSTIKE